MRHPASRDRFGGRYHPTRSSSILAHAEHPTEREGEDDPVGGETGRQAGGVVRKTRLFRRCGGAASLPHVTGSDTSTTSALIDCRPATTQETLPAPSSDQGEGARAPGRASRGKWWHGGGEGQQDGTATMSQRRRLPCGGNGAEGKVFGFSASLCDGDVAGERLDFVATILVALLMRPTLLFEETALIGRRLCLFIGTVPKCQRHFLQNEQQANKTHCNRSQPLT